MYFAIVSGVIYGIMTSFLVYFGWRVYRIRLRAVSYSLFVVVLLCVLSDSIFLTHPSFISFIFFFLFFIFKQRSRSLRHPFSTSSAMAGLTVAVFLVFVVKPISAFQSDVVNLPDATKDSIALSDFFLVFLCEILPTATILMVFRAVPSSRVTRCSVCCRSTQSLEELEESLTRRQGWQGQWSASNSNEYWDRRRKSDVLGSIYLSKDNGNGVVSASGGGMNENDGNGGMNHMNGVVADGGQQTRHSSNDMENGGTAASTIMSVNDDDDDDEHENNTTRDLYDSDSDSSPFARAKSYGTPGTPLFLPPSGVASFVPPIPGSSPIRGGHFIPPHQLGGQGGGSPSRSSNMTNGLAGLGPRDLLASVSTSFEPREKVVQWYSSSRE